MRDSVRRANIRYRVGIGHRNMLQVLAHFAVGTTLALAISLWFEHRAGCRRFSLSFGFVVIGTVCAALSHFLSPWATPAIVLLYLLTSLKEFRYEQTELERLSKHQKPAPPQE